MTKEEHESEILEARRVFEEAMTHDRSPQGICELYDRDPWFRETFEKVKAHLLAQGKQAKHDGADGAPAWCCYRVPGTDLKCAIGCLIPDDVYSPDIEGGCVYDLPTNMLRSLGAEGRDVRMRFLELLQNIHDCIGPHRWAETLDEFESDMKAEGLL